MKPVVTVIGEALIDVVVPVSGQPVEHVGGSPTNVAIGLARLGHRTRLVTQIGPDQKGQRIADLLAAEMVELSPESVSAEPTSTATVRLDAAGAASYDFSLSWRLDASRTIIEPGQHLHTGSIAAAVVSPLNGLTQAVTAASQRSTISYDPNIRPALLGSPDQTRAVVEHLVSLADLVKASDEDVSWLYPGKPLARVLEDWAMLGPAVCAVTCGADQTLVMVAGELSRLQPLRTSVVDTVGAGDAFMAGLISGLLDGQLLGGSPARERLQSANFDQIATAVDRALACAAITVSRAGANPPTRQDLAGEF